MRAHAHYAHQQRVSAFGCVCVLCFVFVCGAVKIILPFLTIHQFIFGILVNLCIGAEVSEI